MLGTPETNTLSAEKCLMGNVLNVFTLGRSKNEGFANPHYISQFPRVGGVPKPPPCNHILLMLGLRHSKTFPRCQKGPVLGRVEPSMLAQYWSSTGQGGGPNTGPAPGQGKSPQYWPSTGQGGALSTGPVLAQYWPSTGQGGALSTGPVLAQYWPSTGPVLAQYWTG